MEMFQTDAQFEFEFQRTMGQVAYGGAEIGECVSTARRVIEGDPDSWHDEWIDTADWLHSSADQAQRDGHRITARDGFLRSANYYRTAEFFLHADPGDARIRTTSTRGVESFRRAAALFDPPIEVIEIPYEQTTLPGYFFRADGDDGTPSPTVIIHNGFDGTAEELFAMGGRAGQERGFHILVFDGPGQGQAIREQGLTFRSDWESVITPVVDYAVRREDVDSNRIGLIGISLGGVLAPRAAAFENRIAAVVAWDGVYDAGAAPLNICFKDSGQSAESLVRRFEAPQDTELDAHIESLAASNGTLRWVIDHGTWVMGAPNARALFRRYFDFTLAGGVAEQIECPVLILEAADDFAFQGQPRMLSERLRAPHELVTFTRERGGELHNQIDVLRRCSAVIFDWLARELG